MCEQGWAKGWHARQLVKLITEARDLLRTAIASRRLNNLESALAVANFLPIVVREASQAEALVTRLHREAAVAKHIAGTCARDTRQQQDLLNALAAPSPLLLLLTELMQHDALQVRHDLEDAVREGETLELGPSVLDPARKALAGAMARTSARSNLLNAMTEGSYRKLLPAIDEVLRLQEQFPEFMIADLRQAQRLTIHMRAEHSFLESLSRALQQGRLTVSPAAAGAVFLANSVHVTGLQAAVHDMRTLGPRTLAGKELLRLAHVVLSLREMILSGDHAEPATWWALGRLLKLAELTAQAVHDDDAVAESASAGIDASVSDMFLAAHRAALEECHTFHMLYLNHAYAALANAASDVADSGPLVDTETGESQQPLEGVQRAWLCLTLADCGGEGMDTEVEGGGDVAIAMLAGTPQLLQSGRHQDNSMWLSKGPALTALPASHTVADTMARLQSLRVLFAVRAAACGAAEACPPATTPLRQWRQKVQRILQANPPPSPLSIDWDRVEAALAEARALGVHASAQEELDVWADVLRNRVTTSVVVVCFAGYDMVLIPLWLTREQTGSGAGLV